MVLFQGLCTTILFLTLIVTQHGRLPARLCRLPSNRWRGLLVRHLIYVHLDVRVGELGPLLRAIIREFLSPPSFLPGTALQLELELLDPHRLHLVVVHGDCCGLAAIEGGLPRLRLEGWVVVGKACLAFDAERACGTLESCWGTETLRLAK